MPIIMYLVCIFVCLLSLLGLYLGKLAFPGIDKDLLSVKNVLNDSRSDARGFRKWCLGCDNCYYLRWWRRKHYYYCWIHFWLWTLSNLLNTFQSYSKRSTCESQQKFLPSRLYLLYSVAHSRHYLCLYWINQYHSSLLLCSYLFYVPFFLLLWHFKDLSFLPSSKIVMSRRMKVFQNNYFFRKKTFEFLEIRRQRRGWIRHFESGFW